jgi:peptidoglycan/LPS O-acetylase OafA/YrhL
MLNILIFIIIYILLLIINYYINKNRHAITTQETFLSFTHTNILRGIAASFVVFQHIGNIYGSRAVTPLGGIGVSLFLICSAYGLSKSYEKRGLDNFTKKRLLKILIPYWITVIIYNILHYNTFAPLNIMKQILLINTIPYMWFVQLILILYIAFYIVYRIIPNNSNKMIAFFILSLISILLIKDNLWAEQSFAFFVGLILSHYYPKCDFKDKRKVLLFSFACLIIGFASLCLKQLPQIRNANYIIINIDQAVLKTITSVGIIYLTSLLLKLKLFVIFILPGKVSYEIYLIHTLFLYILTNNKGVKYSILFLTICNISIIILKYIIDKICNIKIINSQLKTNKV